LAFFDFGIASNAPRAKSLEIESIVALTLSWSMIFSEGGLPLFRIMLQAIQRHEPRRACCRAAGRLSSTHQQR
jgi:hypothetical protein